MDKYQSRLHQAFPVDLAPSDPLQEGLYDDVHDGVKEIRSAIQGKMWPDIDLLFGEKNDLWFAFAYMTPKAKFYYMPGIMLAFLDPLVIAHNDLLLDSFIQGIDPRRSGDNEFNDMLLAMDRRHSVLVTEFLLEMVRSYGNRVAVKSLGNYWDVFEKDIPNDKSMGE